MKSKLIETNRMIFFTSLLKINIVPEDVTYIDDNNKDNIYDCLIVEKSKAEIVSNHIKQYFKSNVINKIIFSKHSATHIKFLIPFQLYSQLILNNNTHAINNKKGTNICYKIIYYIVILCLFMFVLSFSYASIDYLFYQVSSEITDAGNIPFFYKINTIIKNFGVIGNSTKSL